MIIKTKEFDNQFNRDIHWITINRNLPLLQKGSYKTKEWGDIITDIDLTARVYFNPKLIDIISNVLYKNRSKDSPFTFIHMAVGRYDGFNLPWKIDDNGGCDYDPQRAKDWFEHFQNNMVELPQYIIYYISEKLFSNDMKISNLIDIENALHPYAEIVWSEFDIRRGFVQKNNKRYYLIDVMKTETPVLEYVYRYKDNEYVAIDVGLVDKQFEVPPSGAMYRYYINDWYKVMKTFRWKLIDTYKEAYFQTMNKITQLVAIKYQLDFIEKLKKSKVLPSQQFDALLQATYEHLDRMGINHKGISLFEISNHLYEEINKTLKDSVVYYAKLLKPSETEKILLRLARGASSQIPVTQKHLSARRQVGIKCPFFPTDMDEYEQLTALALRMDMDVDRVVNCFSQVAIEMNKSVSQVIKDVVKENAFSIQVLGETVILKEHGQEKGRYPVGDKKKLMTYVLLKRN